MNVEIPYTLGYMGTGNQSMTFGRWLKILRTARGFNKQGDLAKVANIDQSNISLLESGARNPTGGNLLALSDALEIDIEIFRRAAAGDFDMSVITANPEKETRPPRGYLRDLWDIVSGLHGDDLKTLLAIAKLMKQEKKDRK